MDAPIHAGENPGLASFLESLLTEGVAAVSTEPLRDDASAALAVLRRMDEVARAELGLEAPPCSREAALWAARLFYHLCQFTVCRDIGEEQIKAECGVPCPVPRNPATDWSADLTLRHLPQVFQMARHLGPTDPLVGQLQKIAGAWPLSSVGIPGVNIVGPDSFVEQPALRRLYADRIIAAGDTSRLGDVRVDDLLRADAGVHRDLAPVLAEKLFQTHDTD
jgi:hypothetical protein